MCWSWARGSQPQESACVRNSRCYTDTLLTQNVFKWCLGSNQGLKLGKHRLYPWVTSPRLSTYMCVCTHVSMSLGLCLCVSLCVCGVHVYKPDTDVGCLPQFGLHIFSRSPSLNPELIGWLDSLASKSQGFSWLCLPVLGYRHTHHAWLYVSTDDKKWSLNTEVLILTQRALSPLNHLLNPQAHTFKDVFF